ncbi:MAG: hypothetical protein ABIQ04_03320 [Candidatus Saccharimonadales bacterium]
MSQQVRTNQGGSVLSFMIIAAALLFVILGGIYIVRREGTKTQSIGDSAQTSDGTTSPAATDNKGTDSSPSKTPTSPDTTSNRTSESSQGAVVLPQTGPTETTVSALMLSILVGLVVAYSHSKRSLSSL